jgi:hypothetical protein
MPYGKKLIRIRERQNKAFVLVLDQRALGLIPKGTKVVPRRKSVLENNFLLFLWTGF